MMGGIGQMIFGIIFNFALMMLFAPKPKDTVTYGPRLDNLKPAVKEIQGQVINLTYGVTRISGTVFWASAIRETVHKDTTEYSSKGGGGGYTHTDITYTYDCDIAVGICEGPILGIRKIWANKDLIYNSEAKPNYVSWLKWRLYNGTEYQAPDPILQANFGTDLTPAHRGLAYIVFEQFQLDPFGRRIPQAIEFEVVAKGVTTGSASKYTQIDSTNFGDYGDDEVVPVINVMLLVNNNTLIVPILNWSANSYGDAGTPNRWAILNTATSTVTKVPIASGYTWSGHAVGYGTWVSGMSIGGWHRHLGGFAWLPLNWGGGYRDVPCYIQACSYDISQNDYAYYYIFNIVNGKKTGHGYLNGGYVGSFNDFYYAGIGNNTILTAQVSNSQVTLYEHDISEITKQGINPDPGAYDEYGFPKEILNISEYHNKEVTYPVNKCYVHDWKNNLIHHLVGFPKNETIEHENYDPITEPFKTSYVYTYKITDTRVQLIGGLGRPDIIQYENCKYNITDSMEHGFASIARVEIKKKEIKYYKYKASTETITTTDMWYPAEMGPAVEKYDADPLPPDQNPPYDLHINLYTRRAVFVHYISGNTISNNGYYPKMWLRLKDGTEIIGVDSKIFKKEPFSSNTFPSTYEEWLEQYGDEEPINSYQEWQLYMSINSDNIGRVTKPNNLLPDFENKYKTGYFFDTAWDDGGARIANINDRPSRYGYSTTEFVYKVAVSIPSTYYYSPGATKVYWNSGNTIYSMNLSTFEVLTEVTSTVSPYQIIPYSGDFIGYAGTSGFGPYAEMWYIQKQLIGKAALLGEIVLDISTKAGIEHSILDISTQAYNVQVNGFNISDDIKLIDALETLLMHYFIDAYESEWKIKIKTRKEAINNIITIEDNDLGVKNLGENYNEKYRITLREDTQLPQSVTYNYISVDNGYSQANCIAIRNVDFNLGIKSSIKAPLALYTNEAYSNAFRILFDMWRATKEYEFRLPNNYSYLEPGDIVLLPVEASEQTNEYLAVKISEVVAQTNQYLELKGIEEDARITEGMIFNDGAYEATINTLLPISETKLTILDIKPLFNKFSSTDYDIPGIYVGAHSNSNYWQGGSLFGSFDNVSYVRALDFYVPGGIGGLIYSITNYKINPLYFDTLNSITIQVTSFQDFFEPTEDDFYYLESGTIAIVSESTKHVEILQYKDITYINESANNKLITFSKLQRGLYNTYNYNAGFTFNDKVYYIPNGLKKLSIDTNYYNSAIYYKGVSFGQSIDSTTGAPYKYNLNWYTPYGVCNEKAVVSGSNIVLTWTQRERNKPGYLFSSPTLYDVLEYKLEIYNGNTLIRTVEAITTNTYTYTSADIITDGFTLYDTIKFVIKRKAEFHGYNHSISNTFYYIPNYVLSTILTDNYPTAASITYIDFSVQESLLLDTNDNTKYTVLYNNYNGINKLTTKPALFGLSSKNISTNENLYYSGVSASSTYTIFMFIKVNSIASGSYIPLVCNTDGSYSYLPSLQLYGSGTYAQINHSNGYCGQYVWPTFNMGEWVFLAVSATVGSRAVYLRSLSDSTYYTGAVSGCSGGGGILPSTGYIFNSGTKNIDVQEFCIMSNIDLYVVGGNTYTEFDKLFEIGKKKWLKQ